MTTKSDLCTRLDVAIDHATARNMNHHTVDQLKDYRHSLESDDPLVFVLLRHFAANLCDWTLQK